MSMNKIDNQKSLSETSKKQPSKWQNISPKVKKISETQIELVNNILLQTTGFSLEQHKKLAQEKNELNFLNKYRSALSLWAEHTMDTKSKIIVTLDWRDTAGKGSNIKRVTEYLINSRFSVKAFPWIPTESEKFKYNWFRRYENFFPEDWKITFFDRSWYNRASVEAAMWFCTKEEYYWFMENVNEFERKKITEMGYYFLKIYLSITKDTQKLRLKNREQARKRWKSSPVDAQAQEKWNYYTLAKAKILENTDSEAAPWIVIDSNERWLSSSEIIKSIINKFPEVAKLVEKDLGIDLKPNPKITRTAKQELDRMKESWDLKAMKTDFKFKNAA